MENICSGTAADQLVSPETISPIAKAAREYIAEANFALVEIPAGRKGPTRAGWQLRENACTDPSLVPADCASNIGIAHVSSLTCALDIDDHAQAHAILESDHGIRLDALLAADDAVQIRSGRPNSVKLLYRLPTGVELFESRAFRRDGKTIFELRCATAAGTTVQDLLPPSRHPSGSTYAWAGSGEWRNLPVCPPALLSLVHPANAPAREEAAARTEIAIDHATVTEVRSALNFLDADDRETWIQSGFDLYELGATGRELWITWSQQSDKWKPGDARQWRSFKGSRSGYRNVFRRAQEAGWVNPRSAAALIATPSSILDDDVWAATVAYVDAELRKNAEPSSVMQRSTRNSPRIQCAADLLERQFDPVRWAVRDLVPEGVSILVGAPKLGKSWLTLQAAIAISSRSPLWAGREPEEGGEVLMLALEDNDRRMKARLAKLMQGRTDYDEAGVSATSIGTPVPPDVSRIHYATEWPRADEGGVDELDRWLSEHPQCRLVVIDTLAKFRTANPARNKTAYQIDYEVGDSLRPIVNKHRVAIVLVHHTRKQASEDVLDTISGTQGLSGSVDALLILRRERGAGDGALFVVGRDIENEEDFALKFDQEQCTWSSLGTVEDARRSRAREDVLRFLRDVGGDASPKQIAEGLGKKDSAVRMLLKKMLAAGEVENWHERYRLPQDRAERAMTGTVTLPVTAAAPPWAA